MYFIICSMFPKIKVSSKKYIKKVDLYFNTSKKNDNLNFLSIRLYWIC